MTALEVLSERFSGLDLQCRNTTAALSWPRRWRAKLRVNKNERAEYRRIVAWGDEAESAVTALAEAVARVDAGGTL